jgi:hypothetical protein
MKYLRLNSVLMIIAICLLTIWIFKVRSGEIVPYKGAGGWTIEQSVTKLPPGKEPMLVGKNIEYFHPDGRRRAVQISLMPDGTVGRQLVTTVTPGVGIFTENEKQQVRHFVDLLGPDAKFGRPIDVDMERKSEDYLRDEIVLGYRCLVSRSELPDGDVIESFNAVELGLFPIKQVVTSSKLTVVTEPTAIRLGVPPEVALVRHDDWPIDFSSYEKRIATVEELARNDQRYAGQVAERRSTLEKAKRELR